MGIRTRLPIKVFLPWDSDIGKLEREGKEAFIFFGVNHHLLHGDFKKKKTGIFLGEMVKRK